MGLLSQVPFTGQEWARDREREIKTECVRVSVQHSLLVFRSCTVCLSRFALIKDKGSLIGCRCTALMSITTTNPLLLPCKNAPHLHICHSMLCSISLTSPPPPPCLSLIHRLSHTSRTLHTWHTIAFEEPKRCRCICCSMKYFSCIDTACLAHWIQWAVQKNIQTTPTRGIPGKLKQTLRNGKNNYFKNTAIQMQFGLLAAVRGTLEKEIKEEERQREMLGVCLWALAFPSFRAWGAKGIAWWRGLWPGQETWGGTCGFILSAGAVNRKR